METITTTVIVTLAFTKFLETAVEKFTEAGLQKIDELRNKIWTKLKGNAKAEEALKAVEDGNKEALENVQAYVTVAMNDDENFAAEVKALANNIQSFKVQDHSLMIVGETNYLGETSYYGKNNNFDDKTIQFDSNERPIWEIVSELGEQISDKEWEEVPPDLSKNFDYYQHKK